MTAMKCDRDFEKAIDPLKGPKGDTAFLKSNYQTMSVGSFFRTVKAQFSPKQIKAGAKQAGFGVSIQSDGPWLKVTVTKRLPSVPATKKSGIYAGAGKAYPRVQR